MVRDKVEVLNDKVAQLCCVSVIGLSNAAGSQCPAVSLCPANIRAQA